MTDRSPPMELVPLSNLVQRGRKITYGIVQPGEFVSDGVILVRGRDYSAGWREKTGFARVTQEIDAPYKRSRLKTGDIVMTIVGANTGTIAVVPDWLDGANITQTTARIAIDAARASPCYVEQVLRSSIGQEFVYRYQKGGAQPGLNLADVERFRVPLPTMPEQCKIATILRTWDCAIDKLSALRSAKALRFIGLRQKLFGNRNGSTDQWTVKPLSAVTSRVRRKNDGGNHPVMTISAKSGFLMQSDKFARDMAGSSAERYTLLYQGEFAYNKGNSLTSPYGCIYELDRPSAIVPFVYYSFSLSSNLDRDFYKHLFSAGFLNHQLSRVINSGVRNDGLLNLDADDFFGCKVPVPPIEEQRAIGRILSTAKRELDLIDREIAGLARQKRGLMQKLLTGEWQVTLENA